MPTIESADPRPGIGALKTVFRAAILVGLFACAVSAEPVGQGQSQSFTGNFVTDADSPNYSFVLSGSAPVTIVTYSYAGGTNSAGTVIPEGGFDPTISLYDSMGNLIGVNRDGGCGNVAVDSVTSFCWDSYLNVTLPAGTYTVAITQSENFPNGPTLANSFAYAGQPNFTTPPGVGSGNFWDLFPSQRTSAYAFDIISTALVPSTSVSPPPPAPPTPPPALSFTSPGSLGGFIPGATVSGTFGVTGGTAPYTWSATGLPAGLSLNSSSGAYSGTAGNPGVYSFTLQAADSESPPVSGTFNVSYSVLGISTSALPNGTTAGAYSASVGAVGGTGPYSFSATGLPPGLSISSSGLISGTPTASGSFTVVVQVTSGGLTASGTLGLAVTAPGSQPLTVSGATLPPATVAVPYTGSTLQASGGAPPYNWSVFGGVLPSGLSLSSTGSLQGTPTLALAATYAFTAQVTDSAGVTASATFNLAVTPAPVTFSLGTFPAGVAGAVYPLQILTPLVSGGQPGYTFALTSGTLPGGLTLTGQEISGTPTTAGTFPFTITATDSSGNTVSASGSITINAAQTTLILSQSSVSFSLTAGANGVPTPAQVTVRSSAVSNPLAYSFAVTPAASWLDVTGGVSTPGSLTIALDPTAPSLPASATPYSAVIAVTCILPGPCAGNVQNINVALTVTAPSPQFTLSSSLLSFSAFSANPATSSQLLTLQNSGGGTIDIASITPGAAWLSVIGTPATLTAGPGTPIVATANPSGLSPGYYTTTLTVNSSAGSQSIPVTLLVAQSLTMTLDPGGAQYAAPAGGSPGNGSGSFNVSAAGAGTVSWSASLDPDANWITLNTSSGTSTAASAGSVSYSLNGNVIASLAPAVYYATISVSASGVADPLQSFEVVLEIDPSTSQVNPVLSSAGLIFISSAASPAAPQTLQVYSSSATATPYQASAATTDGASWLVVSPATGSATNQSAGQSTVSVNAASLAPGVYSGGVSYAFSSDAVRTVNVTLLVLKPVAGAAVRRINAQITASCTPTRLIGTQTSLYNNFAQAAGWPTPLSVNLIDDCGAPVNGASMTTTFSNGDPPLALTPQDSVSGNYIGTWTPRNPSPQVTVTATAMHSPLPMTITSVTGEVRTNSVPILTPNGTLDVFNPVIGAALAPGQVIQIYGSDLAASTAIAPVPLPTSLGGATVLIGGVAAPLFYSSAGQIDAQIPFSLSPGTQYQILAEVNGALSTPAPLQLSGVSPSLANLAGQALAEHLDGSLISSSSPAQPGEYVVLYLSGLGNTTNPVDSGAITPSNPSTLSIPLVQPTLTLNGVTIPTLFVGLTPTAVGLYQIDFQMPTDVPAGSLPLLVTQGGVVTNTVLLPVQ